MTAGEEKPNQLENIEPDLCPVCIGEVHTNILYKMQDSDTKDLSYWYHCQCGVIWNKGEVTPPREAFGKKYIETILKDKEKYADAMMYPCRIYSPFIEEITYGRKMLDVGYTSPYNMMAFRRRGWVSYGIEIVDEAETTPRLIKGDFENFSFPQDLKFDLIWMSNVLENFKEPQLALEKVYDLMPPNGVLYICTPDTNFVYNNGVAGFSHWNKANYIMWSTQRLRSYLEQLGFNVLLQCRSYEKRTTAWDVQHIIAQKKFF